MSVENFTPTVSSPASTIDKSSLFRTHDGDVATTLVLAIAEVECADPTDLGFVLNDYVDPDALNRLFGGDRATHSRDTVMHLRIAGRDVTIYGNGDVLVSV